MFINKCCCLFAIAHNIPIPTLAPTFPNIFYSTRIRIPSQLCNANSQNGCLVVMLADVNGNRKSLLCDFSNKQHSTFLTCANKMKNKMKEQIKGAFRPVSSGQRLSHSVKGGALCNRIWEREGKKEMAGGGNKREVE